MPKVINSDYIDTIHKGRSLDAFKERSDREQQQQREDCLHIRSRLDVALSECQRERQGKLEPFLSIAGQTLETFIKFLNDEAKPQQSYNSKEHHLVLALAGVITNPDPEVCLQSLRLLQSLLLEREVMSHITTDFLSSFPLRCIHHLASSRHPALKQTAQETLEDLASFTNSQTKDSEKEQ
ncbi:hypothetical protein cypCar_00020150 [Cyprinus carpio]|nr:hypothetical protein cypCar_00020150 [Cyprinus carpio]